MDVVALLATLLKEERLRESQWILLVSINEKLSRNEHENALVDGRLIVSAGAGRIVRQVRQSTLLFHNLLNTHELFAFVGEHALISVEGGKASSVSRKCLEIVSDELRADFLE